MSKLIILLTCSTLCVVAFSATIVNDNPDALDAAADSQDWLKHSIQRMRSNLRRQLGEHAVNQARMLTQLQPSSKHADDVYLGGFTTNVNDMSDGIFRPILPGTVVPNARQASSDTSSPTPIVTKEPPTAQSQEPDTTDEPENDSVCFPAHATVHLEDGSVKPMRDVRIGDRVQVAHNLYSPVFMFTHKLPSVRHAFVRVRTRSAHTLTLTRGHYLLVNGVMAAASTVHTGDALTLADGSASVVTNVHIVSSVGLFNPQTVHGSIVVDGIRASTYTTAVHPQMAHALLTPLRSLYERFGLSLSCFDQGADRLASLLPSGQSVL